MADHVDQINMNNAMLSANTYSVKEEQREDGSFVEDNVYISETAITVGNARFQGPIWHGKKEQYVESIHLDNIKTEIASFEVTEVQNDDVKIVGGISADNVKDDFDNRLLYCEHCEAYYLDYCIKCGMLVHILNKNALNSADNGAQADIPKDILQIQDCFGQTGIYALRIIPVGVKFGPFTGLGGAECPWKMKGEKFVLDNNKCKYLNWMQYVNPTTNTGHANLHVFQSEDNTYYQSTRQIQAGDELLVYFGDEYGSSPNKIVRVDFVTTTKDIGKDIFACTFCCFGFSSKSFLAKHKTVCVEDRAGTFSIEELTQCPFCKIYLDAREYFEHHMSFCGERARTRNSLLPTTSAKDATAALNGRKRCLRPLYKCEECKYRAKYQTELKEHIKQHYEVKIYKCGVCNRRFMTREILRLHVENTHAYVGGKNDQENSTTDYEKALIKVEPSSSRDQKKMFKCALCVFRAKYKQSLRRHKKRQHLKGLDYKCDSCEYRTNRKHTLLVHVKNKHLKEFDHKCDSCEFGTNSKHNLKVHIKTKHSKEFDFKCDRCDFGTNTKTELKRHIKSKHLKQFDFKCNKCEYRTNTKNHLEGHIKTKHLKQFDFKCDKCEFGTNTKTDLTRHIKSKHLNEFDFKCDKCEYRTNKKSYLKGHIKTKHLKEFDFKCEKCEFGTNSKTDLTRHIKSKHLKEFDYKCDSCEFVTYMKTELKRHIKTKHLKEFDFKCDKCEYRTNTKNHLEGHIKTKHLMQFDFKCDRCEYRTNYKSDLKRHVRTKHMKEFDDFECD